VLATAARAADCLAAPNSPAPLGSHWYYRLDWATQHKCWYVRAFNQSDKQAGTQAAKEQASLSHSVPFAAKPKPKADSAPLSVSPRATDTTFLPVDVLAVKPNDGSVSGANDETTSSISEAPAWPQGASISETNEQVAASAPTSVITNATAPASPVEYAPQASRPSDLRSESGPGTSVTTVPDAPDEGSMNKAGVSIKPAILIVTFGLVLFGILSLAAPKLFENETEKIRPSTVVSEIAASIASKLARNQEGNAESGDLQHTETFVLSETSRDFENERPAQSGSPKPVTSQISPPRPQLKANSDEYWAKAEACFSWAREAPTDELRLGCLALAQTWLTAALRIDGGALPALPRAPTI
jgi:hypothetical protein